VIRRERVISEAEEARYLAAALPLLHDVSVVLFDTGVRPEECHCLRWEHINWDGGRHGLVLVAKGKTKAARRVLPMSPRFRWRLRIAGRWRETLRRVGFGPLKQKTATSITTASSCSTKKRHADDGFHAEMRIARAFSCNNYEVGCNWFILQWLASCETIPRTAIQNDRTRSRGYCAR